MTSNWYGILGLSMTLLGAGLLWLGVRFFRSTEKGFADVI